MCIWMTLPFWKLFHHTECSPISPWLVWRPLSLPQSSTWKLLWLLGCLKLETLSCWIQSQIFLSLAVVRRLTALSKDVSNFGVTRVTHSGLAWKDFCDLSALCKVLSVAGYSFPSWNWTMNCPLPSRGPLSFRRTLIKKRKNELGPFNWTKVQASKKGAMKWKWTRLWNSMIRKERVKTPMLIRPTWANGRRV